MQRTPRIVAPPPPSLKAFVQRLADSDPGQLADSIAIIPDWPWPKIDLSHFQHLVKRLEIALDAGQNVVESIRFLRLLWDNSTNRALYATSLSRFSWEKIGALLEHSDFAVVYEVLSLFLKAQRGAGRMVQRSLAPFTQKITILASKEYLFKHIADGKFIAVEISPGVQKDLNWVTDTMKLHSIPESRRFELIHKARILDNEPGTKEIRLLAVSVLGTIISKVANILPEEQGLNLMQDDIPAIVSLLSSTNHNLQFSALAYIDTLAHFKLRLSDVLTAIGANLHHGTIMTMVRALITGFKVSNTLPYPMEFSELIFSFISYILNTNSGGSMLVASGLIPTLVGALVDPAPIHFKHAAKCANTLDNVMFSFPASITNFQAASGLKICVSVIEHHLDESLKLLHTVDLKESNLDAGIESHRILCQRIPILRSSFKLLLHLLQSSGVTEPFRNLIDTSLPKSILRVFENRKFAMLLNVYGLALNIFATLINNEPSTLTIMQEMGIPAVFLEAEANFISLTTHSDAKLSKDGDFAMKNDVDENEKKMSAEVISALPNAFSAVCLNPVTLALFSLVFPIDNYLACIFSKVNMPVLGDNDVPILVGNSIDEFMRHFPSLKERVMQKVVEAFGRVVDQAKNGISGVNSELAVEPVISSVFDDDVVMSIDTAARFFEGLFQNVSHAKEFVRLGGAKLIFDLIQVKCLPYSFTESNACYGLFYIFRVICESSGREIYGFVKSLFGEMANSVLEVTTGIETVPFKLCEIKDCISFLIPASPDSQFAIQNAFSNLKTLKTLTRLLMELFSSGATSSSKLVACISGVFGDLKMVKMFENIRRMCVAHGIILEGSTPIKPDTPLGGTINDAVEVLPPLFPGASPIFADPESVPQPVKDLTLQPASEHNSLMWSYLFKEVLGDLNSIFRSVLRNANVKKITDLTSRANAFAVCDDIARMAVEDLMYSMNSAESIRYKMVLASVKYMDELIRDERTGSMQTVYLVTFEKQGGIKKMMEILSTMYTVYTETLNPTVSDIIRSIVTTIKFCTSSKAFGDSVFTSTLVSRTAKPRFEAHSFLIRIRYDSLKALNDIWCHQKFTSLPVRVIDSICLIMLHIFKKEGEAIRIEAAAVSIRPVIPPQRLVADPLLVDYLVDMGFERTVATNVLVQTRNDVMMAADYILTNPAASFMPAQILASPSIDASGEASTATTATQVVPENTPCSSTALDDSAPASAITSVPDIDHLELLNNLRQEIAQKGGLLLSNIDLWDPTLVFSFRDILCRICQADIRAHFSELIKSIRANILEDKSLGSSRSIAVRLHLLTLIMTDEAVSASKKLEFNEIPELVLILFDALRKSQENVIVPWLGSLFWLLETMLVSICEIRETAKTWTGTIEPAESVSEFASAVPDSEEFVKDIIAVINHGNLTVDTFHSALRGLALLTRTYEIAKVFVDNGGMQCLFENSSNIAGFRAHHPLVMLCLRHALESPIYLKQAMEEEIGSATYKDLSLYLKAKSFACLRDPDIWTTVMVEKFFIAKYDLVRQNFMITRRDTALVDIPATSADRFGEEHLSEVGKPIQYLVSKLLEQKTVNDVSIQLHIQRCFILQCLSEVAATNSTAKFDIMHCTQTYRKNSKNTPRKDKDCISKGKNLLLWHLLNDVIPGIMKIDVGIPDAPKSQDEIMRDAESSWAACLICALCVGNEITKEDESYANETGAVSLFSIRSIVIELLGKNIKEAWTAQGPVEMKFGKIIALCELTYRLLNKRTLAKISNEIVTLQIARIMIDKGFVSLFTTILGHLDPTNPGFKKLVDFILKPLDSLTKAAIAISASKSIPSFSTPKSKKPVIQTQGVFDSALEELTNEQEPNSSAISEMFRNSALGVLENANMDDHNLHNGEFSTDSEEMEEFSSEDEEDEDEGSMDDDEMEIVVSQPYHHHDHESSSSDGGSDSSEDDIVRMDHEELHQGLIAEEAEANGDEEMWESDSEDNVDDDEEMDDDEMDEDENENEEDFSDEENNEFNAHESMEDIDYVMDFENAMENGGVRLFQTRRSLAVPIIANDLNWNETAPQDLRADGFQAFGGNLRAAEESEIHPLLRNTNNQLPPVQNVARRLPGGIAQNANMAAATLNMLEQIFTRHGTAAMPNRDQIMQMMDNATVLPPNMQIPTAFDPARFNSIVVEEGNGRFHSLQIPDGNEVPVPVIPEVDSTDVERKKQLSLLHENCLAFKDDRWKYEARLIYGNNFAENASKACSSIVNILLPAAIEEARILREKEEASKKINEEEAEMKKKEEEVVLKKTEEEAKQKSEAFAEIAEQIHPIDLPVAASTDSSKEGVNLPVAERVMFVIDGEEVDITGSGIDVTFLEALPEDLRRDVIDQHFREQAQSRIAVVSDDQGINSEFLDALPFEIRQELLRQETLSRGPLVPEARHIPVPTNPALAATLRSQFERAMNAPGNPFGMVGGLAIAETVPKITAPNLKKATRESIQLIDRPGIVNLLRLLFVPEPFGKFAVDQILANLCENGKTRVELLGILLAILEDGSQDLASVNKDLADLSLRADKTFKSKHLSAGQNETTTTHNIVAQRCLTALALLVVSGTASCRFFLTEPDKDLKTPKSSKKGKERTIISTSLIPAVSLLSLLERPDVLLNSNILEQLMGLLATVLRPLSIVAKRNNVIKDKPTLVTLESSVVPMDIVDKEKVEVKLPIIPSTFVKSAVNVLRNGICSLKTFQHTLHVIQYLSSYPENRVIITDHLLESAQTVSNLMITEFNDLKVHLIAAIDSGSITIDGNILAKYSTPGADQAKLLRILKTIDYLNSVYHDETGKKLDPNSDEESQRKLRILYDKLKLTSLWQKLNECMLLISDNEVFIHVATALLPVIESFMVVAKPYVRIQKISGVPSLLKQHSDLIENDQGSFFVFTDENRKILNTMVRNNPSLMNGSFSLLVQNPKVLEFDNKRTYFYQQLHKRAPARGGSLQINVRRQYVFEDSYHQLQGKSGQEIKSSKLNVRFHEEEGVDAGGVAREWFSVLARQMFNPNYALFRPSAADKVTYQPNRASGINPEHLSYFKFVGRIIGKAIYDGRLLDAYFTRSFYKCIIGTPVDYKDIEAVDPEFHKSLLWILENDITDVLDLTFSTEVDDFGRLKIVDLKPEGRNLAVTETNKMEYVRLVSEQRLVLAIQDQINAFLSGFRDVISKDLVKIFNEQELELLISGMPDIDIDDWKNNTEYQNYTSSSPQIQWFWRAVRSFSQEERAKLIQFATGTSKVPLEGFQQLQGSSGVQKFQIHKEFSSTTRLPSAHTCFNQIDLPMYESYEQLRQALFTAMSECGTGFGFA